jgi:hypothetical protein
MLTYIAGIEATSRLRGSQWTSSCRHLTVNRAAAYITLADCLRARLVAAGRSFAQLVRNWAPGENGRFAHLRNYLFPLGAPSSIAQTGCATDAQLMYGQLRRSCGPFHWVDAQAER